MGKRMRLVVKPAALKEARLRAGMSVNDVAIALDYTAARIYQLESGGRPGLAPKLGRKLAELLGVDISSITEIEHPQEQAS